jgi:2-polyprenylphenol 6-hydroxylase
MQRYDLVIMGAGIAGLTFACFCRNTNLRLAVIDKDFTCDSTNPMRVSVITAASQKILDQLDVTLPKPHGVMRDIEVWDQEKRIQFNRNELGWPALGRVVENQALRSTLLQRVQESINIDLIQTKKWLGFNRTCALGDVIELTFTDLPKIYARLLVGSDGAHSLTRRYAQIPIICRSYHQGALIATVKSTHPHRNRAIQFFLNTGPLAFLPLSDPDTYSIVWSMSSELLNAASKDLCGMINQVISRFKIVDCSAVTTFPNLMMRHAQHYVQSSLALIGDAAHTVHPLAGQGANLGIADAQCLAQVILAAYDKNRSIGAYTNLCRYERVARRTNKLMLQVIDGLYHVFNTDYQAIGVIRKFSFNVIERSSWIKKLINYYAGGH